MTACQRSSDQGMCHSARSASLYKTTLYSHCPDSASPVAQFLASFLGVYFAIGVLFDLFTLGAVTFSTVQYSTNTEAFMAATREVSDCLAEYGWLMFCSVTDLLYAFSVRSCLNGK